MNRVQIELLDLPQAMVVILGSCDTKFIKRASNSETGLCVGFLSCKCVGQKSLIRACILRKSPGFGN